MACSGISIWRAALYLRGMPRRRDSAPATQREGFKDVCNGQSDAWQTIYKLHMLAADLIKMRSFERNTRGVAPTTRRHVRADRHGRISRSQRLFCDTPYWGEERLSSLFISRPASRRHGAVRARWIQEDFRRGLCRVDGGARRSPDFIEVGRDASMYRIRYHRDPLVHGGEEPGASS